MKNLKTIRKQCGITQAELARLATVSKSLIVKIESGLRKPSIDVAVRLAAALNCTVDDLIEKEPA